MSSPGPVPPPGVPQDALPVTPPDEAAPDEQAPPPRSRYSLGTYGNMVRSLLVILGMVAVLVAIVPRVQSIQQPPVDASSVVTDAARQSGLPFDAPVGLPDGWSATNARYASSTDGLPTWQAGWSTPKGGYVAIRQTKTASPAWLQAATSGGRQTGTTDIAGTHVDEVLRRREQADQPGLGALGRGHRHLDGHRHHRHRGRRRDRHVHDGVEADPDPLIWRWAPRVGYPVG